MTTINNTMTSSPVLDMNRRRALIDKKLFEDEPLLATPATPSGMFSRLMGGREGVRNILAKFTTTPASANLPQSVEFCDLKHEIDDGFF